MMAYFPTPYPDELMYSLLCRYYVHLGCLSYTMALQELYCKSTDAPSKEFVGNLRAEVVELLERLYSVDRLVLDHTMYPQYARFIPLEQKKTVLYRLGHEICDPKHLFCVLPRNEGEQYLRFCPLCVREDRAQYGETYWHRKHQIRNMTVCTKHRCRLVPSIVPAKSEQSYVFYPAETHTQDGASVMEENESVIQYAKYLEAVFDAQMDLNADIPISAALYHGMSRTKYLKPSGRSRYTKQLADDMNDFYSKIGLNSIASMYQIQRVLLGSRFDFSVVCQIGFFLGMEPEELTAPSLTIEQIQQEQNSHYMKDAGSVDWEQLDDETVPLLEQLVRGIYDGSANDNGRPERVSERMVYREMGLLGHQLENMPKCRAIFEQYTESYPETWARKLIWAYHKLLETGMPFYWSDVRKLSGVKKRNLPSTIPYLRKHTDDDTFEQIMAIIN